MKQSITASNKHKALSSKILDMVYNNGDREMFAHQVVCVIQLMNGWRANIPFETAMVIGDVVYDYYNSIVDGTLVFEDLTSAVMSTIDGNAISAIAKVCHIVNPVDFPFIKDSRLNSLFHCTMKTPYADFVKKAEQYCKDNGVDLSRIGTYDLDSELWYKNLNK